MIQYNFSCHCNSPSSLAALAQEATGPYNYKSVLKSWFKLFEKGFSINCLCLLAMLEQAVKVKRKKKTENLKPCLLSCQRKRIKVKFKKEEADTVRSTLICCVSGNMYSIIDNFLFIASLFIMNKPLSA